MTGRVVRFDEPKGYGFIREADAAEKHRGTIFFHYSDIQMDERRYVGEEMVADKKVEFDLEETDDGRHRARNIRVVNDGR